MTCACCRTIETCGRGNARETVSRVCTEGTLSDLFPTEIRVNRGVERGSIAATVTLLHVEALRALDTDEYPAFQRSPFPLRARGSVGRQPHHHWEKVSRRTLVSFQSGPPASEPDHWLHDTSVNVPVRALLPEGKNTPAPPVSLQISKLLAGTCECDSVRERKGRHTGRARCVGCSGCSSSARTIPGFPALGRCP